MDLKEKLLTKSNSYNYYKINYEKSQEEIKSLKNEINNLKSNNSTLLKDDFLKLYSGASAFCNWDFMEYYLKDEFEDKLKEVTKSLDGESKKKFKLYFLRALFVNMITQNSLYFYDELIDQKKFIEFENNSVSENQIDSFKFFGEYNVHSFIDLNLSEEDIEFIKNKDIIDAGAFTGDTSIPLSQITDSNVYAFEPFEESFELLKLNIDKNNIQNIVPVNKSLGNINGSRTLYLSEDNIQGVTSNPNIRKYDMELKVQETTIDSFVDEHKLDVGYITVDIEGAELDLLKGAINTIKSQKPILCISIYHKVSDYFEIIPWISNLNLNYEFEIVKEQPWPFFADTVVFCRVNKK